MSFENFKSKPHVPNYPDSEAKVLKEGTFDLKITDVYLTDDQHNGLKTPTLKKDLPEWKDATPQMAVVFWHKDGVQVRRFNAHGFVRYSELTAADQKTHDELGEEGYAVHKKSKKRVISKTRTESCENILNQFFDACKLPEGSGYQDLPNAMVQGMIVKESFNKTDYFNLNSFKRIKSDVTVKEEETVDEGTDY